MHVPRGLIDCSEKHGENKREQMGKKATCIPVETNSSVACNHTTNGNSSSFHSSVRAKERNLNKPRVGCRVHAQRCDLDRANVSGWRNGHCHRVFGRRQGDELLCPIAERQLQLPKPFAAARPLLKANLRDLHVAVKPKRNPRPHSGPFGCPAVAHRVDKTTQSEVSNAGNGRAHASKRASKQMQ